jgi:hypothetical protein
MPVKAINKMVFWHARMHRDYSARRGYGAEAEQGVSAECQTENPGPFMEPGFLFAV